MSKVKGNNQFIEMLVDGDYYPFFCCKDFDFTQNQDLIEVTSVNSNSAREYEAGLTTASLNINGVTILDNTDEQISGNYLMQQSIRRVIQTLRIRQIDDDGNSFQIMFNAVITSNTLTRTRGSYGQSSVAMTVTGEPTFSAVVLPPAAPVVQEPLYLTFTAGQTQVSNVLLEAAGVEILEVQREGLGHDETTGTPGNRQFKFTGGTGNGIIAFDPTNPSNGEVVYVLYQL
jgi:hypothetical protein